MYPVLDALVSKATLSPTGEAFILARGLSLQAAKNVEMFSLGGLRVSPQTRTSASPEELDCLEKMGTFITQNGGAMLVPMRTMSGSVVGFQGRGIGIKAHRWFVMPYEKFYQPLVGLHFRIDEMLQRRAVVLVEGVFDHMALHGSPVPVASVGGSIVSRRRVEWLSRFVKRVVFCFDDDKAGRDGANSAINQLRKHEVRATSVSYRVGDPNDKLRKYGDVSVQRLFAQIKSLTLGA